VVLQQPVGDIDVRAEQLLATGDPLDHVLPVVQDELEAEITDASARTTRRQRRLVQGAGVPTSRLGW